MLLRQPIRADPERRAYDGTNGRFARFVAVGFQISAFWFGSWNLLELDATSGIYFPQLVATSAEVFQGPDSRFDIPAVDNQLDRDQVGKETSVREALHSWEATLHNLEELSDRSH